MSRWRATVILVGFILMTLPGLPLQHPTYKTRKLQDLRLPRPPLKVIAKKHLLKPKSS